MEQILGANARWLVSSYRARTLGPVFPHGTLLINAVGSFVIGLLMLWTTERVVGWPVSVVVGFRGTFITLSSFAFETMIYLKQGQWALMFTNFLAKQPATLGSSLGGNGMRTSVVIWNRHERSYS